MTVRKTAFKSLFLFDDSYGDSFNTLKEVEEYGPAQNDIVIEYKEVARYKFVTGFQKVTK